jgi:hypothetical protein
MLDMAIEIAPHDFMIVCGHRGREAQDAAFLAGTSEKRWPNSRHNTQPSPAVDVAPWLIDSETGKGRIPWRDEGAFYELSGLIKTAAKMVHVRVRGGSDWDGDGLTEDQGFHDIGHFEELMP